MPAGAADPADRSVSRCRAPCCIPVRDRVSSWCWTSRCRSGGGVSADGTIIDRHHPQCGVSLTGRVVVMTAGRGSSSSSSVLAEQIRAGTAPAAIVLAEPDTILLLGAVVAAELYGRCLPVLVTSALVELPRTGLAHIDARWLPPPDNASGTDSACGTTTVVVTKL